MFLLQYSQNFNLLGGQDDKKTYILRPKDGRTYKGMHDFVEKKLVIHTSHFPNFCEITNLENVPRKIQDC